MVRYDDPVGLVLTTSLSKDGGGRSWGGGREGEQEAGSVYRGAEEAGLQVPGEIEGDRDG